MRLSFPNLPDLGRVFVAWKNLRWRDPLVQVWGLIGIVLAAGMVTYYVRRSGDGEKKNAWWPGELLGSAASDGWHPEIPFLDSGATTPEASRPGAALDLRSCAETAAARKTWRFLPSSLRREIAGLSTAPRRVVVCWSGTRGGDAAALELYYDTVRNEGAGVPGDFVIGNGWRSQDGRIETAPGWLASGADDREELRICLAGDGTGATPAQFAALGELINCIESRSGRVALTVHEPAARRLLAHAE
jgi:hypothetical protein